MRTTASTRTLALSLVVTGVVLALALGRASRAADSTHLTPLAESGKRLFVRNCAVCHGRSATGDGPFRGVLKVAPADLTRIAERHGGSFPDDEIAAFVDGRFVPPAHGTREMPVWGRWLGQPLAPDTQADDVTRGEILALVTYLKTLQRSGP